MAAVPPEELASFSWCGAPVSLWRWPDTGFSVLLTRTSGPITHAFFCIATEAHDDDGLPHTLEHLVFLGSETYPYKGVLDTAANRLFARGTNAWTAVDHTAYTATHAGAEGLLALLPVYADHVLFPTITESGYDTEVHHISGEGEDAGVVYCEMQARENTSYSLSSYELHQLLFPASGYKSETGGRMSNLRESCTHAKVVAYHRQCYRPSGVRLIVVGDVPSEALLASLASVQARLVAKGPDFWPPVESRSWSTPAPRLAASVSRRIAFPSDDEDTGIVRVGWLAFGVEQHYQRAAAEVLLTYFTSTSVSELQHAFVECDPPLAGAVYASTDDYSPQMLTLTFDSVPTPQLDAVCPKLAAVLQAFASGEAALDAERMASVLQRRRLDVLDAAESHPEDAVSAAAIPAFLYAPVGQDGPALREAMDELQRIKQMEGEAPSFWAALAGEALVNAPCAEVVAAPSAQLGKDMAAADAARLAARRTELGPEKLAALGAKLEAATAANDAPMPPSTLDAFPVPSVANISLHRVATLRSAAAPVVAGEQPLPSAPPELAAAAAEVLSLPLPAQFDDVASGFVDLLLVLRTDGLRPDQLALLPTLLALQFESPVRRGAALVPHAHVVAELTAATLSCSATVGFGGGRFSVGAFGEGCVLLGARCEAGKYAAAATLLADCALRGEPSCERVRIALQKALNAVPRTARDGGACASALLRQRIAGAGSTASSMLFCNQQRLLTRTLLRLDSQPALVLAELASLRAALLSHPSRVLLHVAGALAGLDQLTAVWRDALLPGLAAFAAADAPPPGRCALAAAVMAPDAGAGGWARVLGNSAVESGFLNSCAPGPAHWEHPDVAPLTVAIELLTQLEGPFWKQLRGQGLAYSYSISVSPEEGLIYFTLFKAGHVARAVERTAAIVTQYAGPDGESLFDALSVETACSSAVFAALNRERTPAAAARAAAVSYLRGVAPCGANQRLLAALKAVTPQAALLALRTHLVPLFDPQRAHTAACVNPNKVQELVEAFSMQGRTFTAAATLDDAFPAPGEPLCLAVAGRNEAPDGAGCECPRCIPRPGGPFSLPSLTR